MRIAHLRGKHQFVQKEIGIIVQKQITQAHITGHGVGIRPFEPRIEVCGQRQMRIVVNQIEGIRAKIAHIGIEVKYILIFIPFDFSGEVKIQIVVIDRCRSLERAIGILACNGDVFVRVIFEHNGVYHQIRPHLQRLVLSQ